MSVTIFYQPEKSLVLDGGSSSVVSALEKVFDKSTLDSLSTKDLPALRGMAAVASVSGPYHRLIEAIETHGCIRVWFEW